MFQPVHKQLKKIILEAYYSKLFHATIDVANSAFGRDVEIPSSLYPHEYRRTMRENL